MPSLPCVQWLAHMDFVGLRSSPLELAQMNSVYVRLDVTTAASVADFVQFSGCGRSQAMNLSTHRYIKILQV